MTKQQIDALREEVKRRLPEKRLAHVLGVEEQIVFLGELLLPNELDRLRVAALLHDIAKDVPDSEQLALCRRLGVLLTEKEANTPPIIHAQSGAFIAARDFPHLVDEEILWAIRHHTVGAVGMPLFARLLMLSDFTEKGRTWDRCIESRRFLSHITDYTTYESRLQYFHDAFYYALRLRYDYLGTVTEDAEGHAKALLSYYASFASKAYES